MSFITLAVANASEPATVLYLVTGSVGFIIAGIRRFKGLPAHSSLVMLFCKRDSRAKLKSLKLL